jgi:hypothetical protein
MDLACTRPSTATADGVQCDRCGANVGPELRTCRIEGARTTLDRLLRLRLRPEMCLCLPCIGALETAGHKVHVRLTHAEVRAQLRVVAPESEPVMQDRRAERTRHPMSRAAAKEAVPMLVDIARRAVERAIGYRTQPDNKAVHWLAAAIEQCCDKVQLAAKQLPVIERARNEEAEFRTAARRALAAEMRAAKAKLRKLQRAVHTAEQRLEVRQNQLVLPRERYPDAPIGTVRPSDTGVGLPQTAGIYFLWAGEVVEYVGQSIKLCNRVRLGHDQLRKDHLISFIELDPHELTWAECWYIGNLRPKLNFGRSASHRRYASGGASGAPSIIASQRPARSSRTDAIADVRAIPAAVTRRTR